MALDSTSTSRFVPPCPAIRVLLVDDDDAFRLGVAANLTDDGHGVVEHADPGAVAVTATAVTADVAIVDYEMPGLNGLALADTLHRAHPELPVLLVTAYSTRDLETAIAARGFVQLRRKPIDYDTLHDAVHEIAAERGGRPPA